MRRDRLSRRTVLALTGACSFATVGVGQLAGETGDDEQPDEDDGVSRDTFVIREGTDQATTVYVTTAEADGPTVVVLGGIHGNEVAGYVAAGEIADWTIDAGTLVTIPEANAVAIERGTRTDDDGIDLNRQFPESSEPRTDLASAIWDVLSEFDADVVVDLHESIGIYAGDPIDGVGQAIFHSDGDAVAETADSAGTYATKHYVDDMDLAFKTGSFSGPTTEPSGLLVHKAARDLGADSYLVETLSRSPDLETRVQWHLAITERLLADDVFVDDPENGDVPEQPVDDDPGEEVPDDDDDPVETDPGDDDDGETGVSPSAEIRTDPPNADELSLESGQTVTLDATCSTVTDGEIVSYDWQLNGDETVDETGDTIDVTIGANGDHSILLRVTDEEGATDTAQITLSAE
ncbi:succinylglutamate desuccinylase/aspartoacylase family protein [Halobacteria archaeon AArc-curdl1]|uniref:Succinylglutamate desuccinylase/aspartoacylase family protein n=1 Tax=Natronosalvus hydrolyticus TaxID=2979988 RepID=A0AAP2Z862_9EURY|nr:succinylglutamate desuccinylase/aspartoacylase family protein [Halobacteria archaeon AArc-curdl1]